MEVPDKFAALGLTYDDVLRRGLKVADATAFTMCKDNALPIVVFELADGNIARAVRGEAIGTRVGPELAGPAAVGPQGRNTA